MKPVPQELLEHIQKTVPPEAEVIPLSWAFEGEDHNIAVVMPDTTTRAEARQLRDRLLDVVMDWDDAHVHRVYGLASTGEGACRGEIRI